MALVKRSFSLAGHRTSIALEAEFWSALEHMAQRLNKSLPGLVLDVDAARQPGQNLASLLRITALRAQG